MTNTIFYNSPFERDTQKLKPILSEQQSIDINNTANEREIWRDVFTFSFGCFGSEIFALLLLQLVSLSQVEVLLSIFNALETRGKEWSKIYDYC